MQSLILVVTFCIFLNISLCGEYFLVVLTVITCQIGSIYIYIVQVKKAILDTRFTKVNILNTD